MAAQCRCLECRIVRWDNFFFSFSFSSSMNYRIRRMFLFFLFPLLLLLHCAHPVVVGSAHVSPTRFSTARATTFFALRHGWPLRVLAPVSYYCVIIEIVVNALEETDCVHCGDGCGGDGAGGGYYNISYARLFVVRVREMRAPYSCVPSTKEWIVKKQMRVCSKAALLETLTHTRWCICPGLCGPSGSYRAREI